VSFFGNLSNLVDEARRVVGSADPQDVAQATSDHVANMDGSELASHLTEGAKSMDQDQRGSLADTVLGALRSSGTTDGDLKQNGVDASAASSGDTDSVTALLTHAQQNPAALRDAAVGFVRQHPEVLERFAPSFLQGVIGRIA